MSLTMIAILCFGILLFLILIGVHIALSFFIAGFIGFGLVINFPVALQAFGGAPYAQLANYAIICIPLFLIMSEFASGGAIGSDVYTTGANWLSWLPGGLAIASVGGCAMFAAASGSSAATCAAIGKLAIPEMRSRGYSYNLAVGSVAVAGTLGLMIPPSITLVVYGMLTEQPIGKLLIAGFFPGIMIALSFMILIATWAVLRPGSAPRAKSKVYWSERLRSLPSLLPLMIIIFSVMGSIYFGIATPTEAAALGALSALLIGVVMRRLKGGGILTATWEATKTSCMILFIVAGAMYFSTFVAITGLPFMFGDMIVDLQIGQWGVLGILTLLYLILGMFMDGISMQVLTLPILFPTIVAMGFNPIWFGIYVTLMIEIAQVTPPVGINLYVISAIVPDRPMTDTVLAVMPFFSVITADIVILMLFPQIALFLPSLMW